MADISVNADNDVHRGAVHIHYKEERMNDLVCELDHNASKITLGDLLVFIDWMHRADAALEQAEALPPRPEIESEKVNAWVQLIQKVEERHRRWKKNEWPWKRTSWRKKHSSVSYCPSFIRMSRPCMTRWA